MFKKIVFIFIINLIVLPQFALGQQFFRIKADFSIKEKTSDGASRLTIGTVYYDKTYKKIVYQISFPEPETWVLEDTIVYKIKNNKIISKEKSIALNEFSIFHLALNGKLAKYGLENSFYKIAKVEKDQGMIITTWQPNEKMRKYMGKIVMSNIDKKLNGIVFFNPTETEKVVSKQFFKDYIVVKGLPFPGRVIQFIYGKENKKATQITTYKNVSINQISEENMYNFQLPKL